MLQLWCSLPQKMTCTTRTEKEQRKWEKQPVRQYLKNEMTTSLMCYLDLYPFLSLCTTWGLSIIRSGRRHSHTADQPKARYWQTRNLCFYKLTEAHLEKWCRVLSSCLAYTQQYVADTIQGTRVSWRGRATNQFLCCGLEFLFAVVWFIVIPQIINHVGILFFTESVCLCPACHQLWLFIIWWFYFVPAFVWFVSLPVLIYNGL